MKILIVLLALAGPVEKAPVPERGIIMTYEQDPRQLKVELEFFLEQYRGG